MLPMPSAEFPAPKAYLFSWKEILAAVGMRSSATARRQVRRLNEFFDGPILFPTGRGGQPRTDRAKLMLWWDGLEDVWAGMDRRRRDRQATAAESHPYGRTGNVAPGIAGSIRPRRAAG